MGNPAFQKTWKNRSILPNDKKSNTFSIDLSPFCPISIFMVSFDGSQDSRVGSTKFQLDLKMVWQLFLKVKLAKSLIFSDSVDNLVVSLPHFFKTGNCYSEIGNFVIKSWLPRSDPRFASDVYEIQAYKSCFYLKRPVCPCSDLQKPVWHGVGLCCLQELSLDRPFLEFWPYIG